MAGGPDQDLVGRVYLGHQGAQAIFAGGEEEECVRGAGGVME